MVARLGRRSRLPNGAPPGKRQVQGKHLFAIDINRFAASSGILYVLEPLVASLLMASSAQGVSSVGGFLLGADLLDRCKQISRIDYCYGYIASSYDTARAYSVWLNRDEVCVPEGTPQRELVAAVVDHINSDPRNLTSQAASVVIVALQTAFPCTASPPAQPNPRP